MDNRKEIYLMKLATALFVLTAISIITFGILLVLKISIMVSILFAIAGFMFCLWALLLVIINKKANKLNKTNVIAKPEEIQKEILEKLEAVNTL